MRWREGSESCAYFDAGLLPWKNITVMFKCTDDYYGILSNLFIVKIEVIGQSVHGSRWTRARKEKHVVLIGIDRFLD